MHSLQSQNETYGESYKWVPPAVGFVLGCAFIVACDKLITWFGIGDEDELLLATAMGTDLPINKDKEMHAGSSNNNNNSSSSSSSSCNGDVVVILPSMISATTTSNATSADRLRKRRAAVGGDSRSGGASAALKDGTDDGAVVDTADAKRSAHRKNDEWKRVLLLVLAVTVHNFPEGLAVGVGFGSVGKSASATFERARNLAIGVGLQVSVRAREHRVLLVP
jgi:zinc transporter 11